MLKMFNDYVNLCSNIVVVIILSIGLIDNVQGGTCWVKRMESGECKQPLSRNVSKEECCAAGPNVGYTDKEMNDFEYFFAMALGDRTSCIPCLTSCETAKCGSGKRCIMKKGEPRCVCSPMCRSTSGGKSNRSQFEKRTNVPSDHLKMNEPKKSAETSDQSKKRNVQNQRKHRRRKDQQPSHHHHHHQHHGSVDNILVFNENSTNEQMASSDLSINRLKFDQFKNRSADAPNGNVVHRGRHQHKNDRHRLSSSNSNASDHFNQMNAYSRQMNWETKIRSSFIGYDFPYPPNEIQPEKRGPFYNPVCGTDGRTYKTECQLKKRACRQETTSLTVAYRGQCQTSCKHVKCDAQQHCLEDQNLMPHCVTCSTICPPYEDAPIKSTATINPTKLICGTDGITYRNLCEIKRAACMAGRSIPVAYRGPCKDAATCSTVKCKNRQICLQDLISHRPRCVSCNFKCPRKRQPPIKGRQNAGGHIKICGMNNVTYYSWCHMVKDSCQTGLFIDIKDNGPCLAMSNEKTTTITTTTANLLHIR